MKTPRILALFLALASTASAQQLIGYPTFEGSAQSDLNMGGHAITNSTIAKDQVGLSNVENTTLSTWPGTGNVTTLGTITSGTWNGTPVDVSHIAWPLSLQPSAFQLNDSASQFSVNWNSRALYNRQTNNDGSVSTDIVFGWTGNGSSLLYTFDYQPLDIYGDDGTYDNNGVKWSSQIDPLLNISTGDIYGWSAYPWGYSPRYTARVGNLLNSELYSVQNLYGDGDERYKSLNWSQRCLFDYTSQMGDVQWDDPVATQSISIDWGSRFLDSGVTYQTTVYWYYDPDTPQPYSGWTSTPVASWQGGFHPLYQGYGSGGPVGMRLGMTYSNIGTGQANFVLPMDAAPGAIFTIVDTKGGGFKVSQQTIATNTSYPNNVVTRMGPNATSQGAAGYITCAPYSVISIMAVDGYFYGDLYNVDVSSGANATRNWIVVSYSLGTPTFN